MQLDGEIVRAQAGRQALAEKAILEAAAREGDDRPGAQLPRGAERNRHSRVDDGLMETGGDARRRHAARTVGEQGDEERPPVELEEVRARELSRRETGGLGGLDQRQGVASELACG